MLPTHEPAPPCHTTLPHPKPNPTLHPQTAYVVKNIGAHDGQPGHAFPRLAGSHLTDEELGTPALAFVRAVCHLFALDGEVADEVGGRVARAWGWAVAEWLVAGWVGG